MEDEGKQEEKFDFTSEGEALGYISLDQARVLAMRTARESPGAYGRSFRNVPMAFEVVEAEETEDHYVITVSFRPEGEFVGRAGREQFFIEKEGAVALRQVLSLPGRTGWRRFSFGLLAVSLVVIVAAAVGGVFAASGGSGGNDDSAPQAAVPPTSTPAPAPTTAPVAATATPKAGPTPGSASGPLPSVPVPALKEGTLAFKEDFESGAAGGIQLGQGADVDCVASNCFLRQLVSGDPGGVTSWFGETFWQDFVLSVKFNIRSGRGGAAFVWRESDAGAYNMDATPGGGFHTIYFAEPKLEKLTVFELHAPFSSGEWHTLTVQAEGSQISFYLDGVPLGSTEVLDADAPWAGRVGLRTFSAPGDDVEEVWFDDVEVQLLGAKPTTTPAPTPIPGMPGGSVVEVSYGHMLFAGANESYREWEPAETMYNSRWNLFSTEPVSLVASFDDPLDLLGVAPRPQSVNQAEGRYSYQLSPATNFMFILQAQLAVDNGLRLSRNMTPSTLSPGTNQVVIDVSIEILRLPTISGVSVRPVGGHIDLKVGDTSLTLLRDGAESYQSKSGGVRPVRVRSVSGPTSMRLGPLLEPGQKYNLRVDAVFENPNLFPVFYVPTLDTNLDIDTDATRFKISIPSGIQTIAPNISFDAVGIVGEEVAFTFSNPSNEKVFWAITGGSMPQLHQHWREQLQVER